jgi:alanyl-tRNA synthetase
MGVFILVEGKDRPMGKATKRLYFEDAYQIEFESKVLAREVHEGQPVLVLGQTCFYPDSGGQPSDRGTLSGIRVVQLIEREKEILHVLEQELASESVRGKVDWDTRFDHMQQHAGQHVLSQSFLELFEGGTRSFHLGNKSSTLEIDIPQVSEQDIEKVERLANRIVFENREIKSYFVPEDRIKDVPLRRPPQKTGEIRVVEISGFDYSACGGTHPHSTGEIGLIKILKWERIRNNIRFEFICGKRALGDYTAKHRILSQLAAQFSVSEEDVWVSIQRLSSELKQQKSRSKKLQDKVAAMEAETVIQNTEEGIIKNEFSDRSLEEVRKLALSIIRTSGFVVLFGLKLESRAHVIMARSEDLDIDLRELLPVVSSKINGKGGGKPSLVEIAGDNPSGLSKSLDQAYDFISSRVNQKTQQI